jgi:hypothetical protein
LAANWRAFAFRAATPRFAAWSKVWIGLVPLHGDFDRLNLGSK